MRIAGTPTGPRAWRRLGGDLALGVLCAAVLVFWWSRIADSWGARYAMPDGIASAVVCGLAVARRWHRAWCAGMGLAVALVAIAAAYAASLPSEPGPAMALGLSVLVGSAASAPPLRTAAAIAAGGLAVASAGLLTVHVTGVPPVLVLNVAAWLTAIGYATGTRLIASRRRATAARVRAEERRRLARELHDVVGHHLTRIVLQSQAAQILVRSIPPDATPRERAVPDAAARDVRAAGPADGAPSGGGSGPGGVAALAGIEAAGAEALGALRHVVGLLREGGDAGSAVVPRIAELVAAFDGPDVRLELDDDEGSWPPDVAVTVYRVVQEALTNVVRHAPHARTVTVGVTRRGSALGVEVADDGSPGRARRTGFGLAGMRERVEALGGTMEAGPRDGGGWAVRATLPVRDAR